MSSIQNEKFFNCKWRDVNEWNHFLACYCHCYASNIEDILRNSHVEIFKILEISYDSISSSTQNVCTKLTAKRSRILKICGSDRLVFCLSSGSITTKTLIHLSLESWISATRAWRYLFFDVDAFSDARQPLQPMTHFIRTLTECFFWIWNFSKKISRRNRMNFYAGKFPFFHSF